jgi:hypothetical protein
MLDARRDCRYRRGPHRSIGVGLGKVTFHNMLGTSSGVPGFPLTLIHPSAWNGDSRKLANNHALKGARFIGDSSPLATVVALVNFRRD